MPKPLFKNQDIIRIIRENILFINEIDKNVRIKLISSHDKILIKCDSRSIESDFYQSF